MSNIGILGSGTVATTLAEGFLQAGHQVQLGTQHPDKLAAWQAQTGASVGTFADAAAFGSLLVLAVKGTVGLSLLQSLDLATLAGKTILDTTNPIADVPPTNGVLHYFTSAEESLMETYQRAVPAAHFVKAFNSVGAALMVKPDFGGQVPTMFICGNHAPAKAEVAAIAEAFGFEPEDMGAAEAARAIEPLCMLWCIPGFQHNQWATHAFKLLKTK